MYPERTYGINLRYEMEKLLDEYGHWVLLRHYDTTTFSEYYDEITGEGVGGPMYEWTDHVVRSRKVVQTTGGTLSAMEMTTPVGLLTVPYSVYYVKWDDMNAIIAPQLDEIYEFAWSKARAPIADECTALAKVKYNILEAIDMLGDGGRREFYTCICKADMVGF